MFEWLTLWPTSGFLPVRSHLRDMARLLTSGCEKRLIRWLLTGRTSEGGWIRVGPSTVKRAAALHRPGLAGISPFLRCLSRDPRAARNSRLMPVLTAVIAAGGFLTLPMAGNGAIQAIMVQPMHLEIEYEGIEPVPVLGRIKTASATLTADLSPQSYKITARARTEGMMG